MGEIDWTVALVAGGVAFACAMAGGVLTRIGPWYYSLTKPSFQPPDWAFAPAWTVIFALAALSGYLAWQAAEGGERTLVFVLYLSNAVINAAWSGIFFTLRRPDWALYEVALLWLSVLAIILLVWPISALAAQLLIPYLAWVSFAAVLNWAVVRLNAPFSA
ncbi:MAG: TspO/MBR family protein [Pseudomonadota bacterium]